MTHPPGSSARLRYSYVTNGLADHRINDALELLAEAGYVGVALTLDHHHLDPFARDLAARVSGLRQRLDELRLAVTIETGGRFVLNPRRKHEPTLLSDDGRSRRLALLHRALAIAADLGAEAVSFWSGAAPPLLDEAEAWRRLVDGCADVVAEAERRGVLLGFEPEPGMLVDRLDGWERLASELGHPPGFGITLDLGHCQCLEDEPVEACVRRAGSRLVHVHADDMRRGVHEHLDFGEGEVDFPPVLAALIEIGYDGLVSVELSRHSHVAHHVVPRAIQFLRAAELEGGGRRP